MYDLDFTCSRTIWFHFIWFALHLESQNIAISYRVLQLYRHPTIVESSSSHMTWCPTASPTMFSLPRTPRTSTPNRGAVSSSRYGSCSDASIWSGMGKVCNGALSPLSSKLFFPSQAPLRSFFIFSRAAPFGDEGRPNLNRVRNEKVEKHVLPRPSWGWFEGESDRVTTARQADREFQEYPAVLLWFDFPPLWADRPPTVIPQYVVKTWSLGWGVGYYFFYFIFLGVFGFCWVSFIYWFIIYLQLTLARWEVHTFFLQALQHYIGGIFIKFSFTK